MTPMESLMKGTNHKLMIRKGLVNHHRNVVMNASNSLSFMMEIVNLSRLVR